jgi:hypothetical protein
MYVVGATNDTVYQYSLSTAWDVSTASYASKSVGVGSQDTIPAGLAFSATGSAMYVVGTENDTVYQYNITGTSFKWFAVTTTSSYVRAADSTHVVHAADTTQQITSGTFISPNSGISETGTAGVDNDMDFTAGSKCEAEYVVEFVDADLEDADEVWFRIRNADTRTLEYAIATISKSGYYELKRRVIIIS